MALQVVSEHPSLTQAQANALDAKVTMLAKKPGVLTQQAHQQWKGQLAYAAGQEKAGRKDYQRDQPMTELGLKDVTQVYVAAFNEAAKAGDHAAAAAAYGQLKSLCDAAYSPFVTSELDKLSGQMDSMNAVKRYGDAEKALKDAGVSWSVKTEGTRSQVELEGFKPAIHSKLCLDFLKASAAAAPELGISEGLIRAWVDKLEACTSAEQLDRAELRMCYLTYGMNPRLVGGKESMRAVMSSYLSALHAHSSAEDVERGARHAQGVLRCDQSSQGHRPGMVADILATGEAMKSDELLSLGRDLVSQCLLDPKTESKDLPGFAALFLQHFTSPTLKALTKVLDVILKADGTSSKKLLDLLSNGWIAGVETSWRRP